MQQLPTTGAPSPTEALAALAAEHRITLHVTRVADEHQPVEALVIWRHDDTALALVPQCQDPAATLAQLRAAIAERQEERDMAAAFQAASAAWCARPQAGR
ncbi:MULTISPECIES: hypothetical protein [Streptomyces rochei group]|uniref:hypothetical protein n=1 Tax=Streptomyces rochei group TaxID=2867164 RepID=UPI00187473AB|nr:hypothetical protein [Streptomyces vinaceusdrappus]GHC28795.1 hypothetical protein GCM10010308_52560 [Streptomyces vinaceusdrappus]